MSLKISLQNIEKEIAAYLKGIEKELYNTLELNKKVIDDYSGLEKINNNADAVWGIYVFYIQPKMNIATYAELDKLWVANTDVKYTPSLIVKRFQSLEADKEYCLYVGKSEKLSYRIAQHIHQKIDSSTYGLKLNGHKELLECSNVSYSFYPLIDNPKNYLNAAKAILENLEKKLRTELSPLIGKQ